MNILVTGGSGFVGSAFCKYLKESHKSTNIFVPTSKELNLFDLKSIERFLYENEITHIVHLAAKLGGVHLVSNKPLKYFESNLIINYNIVKAAIEQHINRFVTLGSSCSYSEDMPLPNVETQLWHGYPENSYGICKLILLEHLERQNEFEWSYLIPPNILGSGDHFGEKDAHFIPATVKKIEDAIATGQNKIIVWGDGSQTRDFVYIDDIVFFLLEALKNEKFNHAVVNLSTGIETTIKYIVEQIIACMGYSEKIIVEWDSTKPVGSKRKVLSNKKLLELVPGYEFTTFLDGLKMTMTDYMGEIK